MMDYTNLGISHRCIRSCYTQRLWNRYKYWTVKWLYQWHREDCQIAGTVLDGTWDKYSSKFLRLSRKHITNVNRIRHSNSEWFRKILQKCRYKIHHYCKANNIMHSKWVTVIVDYIQKLLWRHEWPSVVSAVIKYWGYCPVAWCHL